MNIRQKSYLSYIVVTSIALIGCNFTEIESIEKKNSKKEEASQTWTTIIPLKTQTKHTKKQEEICSILKENLKKAETKYSKSNLEFDENSNAIRNLEDKNNTLSTEEKEILKSKRQKSHKLFDNAQLNKIALNIAEKEYEKCLNGIH